MVDIKSLQDKQASIPAPSPTITGKGCPYRAKIEG
jgi:hypothetical protein